MAAWWRTLVLVAAAAADRQVASIGAYPGYAGDLAVSGVVVVSETDGGIEMTGTLTGLEASVTGGYHIHSGTTCASADDVGGHYFEGMADDPWTTNYESDSVGVSQTSLSLDDFTLDGAYPVAGRAVVIHAADGTRIGCGVLEDAVYASIGPYPGYAMMQSATLGPYPGYDGDLAVAGSLMAGGDIAVSVAIADGPLGPAAGGAHVHSGTTCASADDVGGHYFEGMADDPWTTTYDAYDSTTAGAATFDVAGGFTLNGDYPVEGRAFGYVIVDQKLYENSGVSSRYVDGRGCYVRVDGRLSNLEAGATGGFHVHTGTSCANVTAGVDPVGGHYYEGDYVRDDPWTVVEWTTSSGCGSDCDNEGAAFEFAFGLETLGRAVHIGADARVARAERRAHGRADDGGADDAHARADRAQRDGLRGGDGSLPGYDGPLDVSGAVTFTVQRYPAAADRQTATIGAYPGYSGDVAVTGSVVVSETDGGIQMWGALAGLEASVAGGFHIHSGTTCASADAVGGHYFEGMADDPWTTTYESDSVGSSSTSLSLDDFTLDDAYPVAGRAVVVHAADGTRVGCGVLESAAPTVKVLGEFVDGFAGLEASASGGFHIHTGTTCADAAAVGGHYYAHDAGAVDPWFDTKYETDAVGAVSGTVAAFVDFDLPIAGRTVVVHDAAGARVACGVLEALGDAGGGDDDDDGPPWSSATILIVAVGAASLAVIGLVVAAMVRRHPAPPPEPAVAHPTKEMPAEMA
ncbi:hypothetical protein JL722_619 [Aureococcus anophagefferens]|nr:hypothetical protein JL722_619 [Aureococcus anophagefferens]